MSAIASCKVNKMSSQVNTEQDRSLGFADGETIYDAQILGFETHKAYIVKDATKKVYLVNIDILTEVEPII